MSKYKKSHVLLQYFAAMTTSITAIGFICGYCWPSPALPYLTGEDSEIRVSKDQSAWIASLYPLGLIIGYMLNPLLVDNLGCKKTLLIFSLPQVASWFLIIIAENYSNLYIARVIGGIGYGGGISSSTVYISEIGNVQTRGVFLVLLKCMMNLGFLFTMLLGAFLSYKNMNLVLLMLPVLFDIIFIFLPDSSYFRQINVLKEEDAMLKLKFVQNKDFPTNDKIAIDEDNKASDFLLTTVNQTGHVTKIKADNLKTSENFEPNDENFEAKSKNVRTKVNNFQLLSKKIDESSSTFLRKPQDIGNLEKRRFFSLKENILWKLFSTQNYRRALEVTLVMGLTNILSGHAGITTFTQQIFTYEGAFLAPEKAAVVLATVTLFTSLLSTQIVEKVKRKVLMMCTGVIAAISLLLVGTFFFCKEKGMDVTFIEWVPLFGITTYDLMISCGMGNVFYVYQGELFASEVKSQSIAFNKISYMALSFLFLLQFQNFIDLVGSYFSFWCFMLGILFGTFSVCVLAPETKGVNLEDIQVLLKSKKLFY